MPEPIPLGAPIWADTTVPDLAAEVAFYTRLFGWTSLDSGEEFGHYTEFGLGANAETARAVAGIAPHQTARPGKPAAWEVAFHVRDCVDAAVQAEKLGAATVTPPMRVGDDLVFAALTDPDGGVFGLFEPLRAGMGFKATREPGAVAWFEYVYDGVPAEAMQFYAELLDWSPVPPGAADGEPVALRTRAEGHEFGACRSAADEEAAASPRWLVHFAVDSVERVAAAAVDLGATVVAGPDGGARRPGAVLASPAGAVFGIVPAA